MEVTSTRFKHNAHASLANAGLQHALGRLQERFVVARANAIAELDDYEATRRAATAVRARVITELDTWLERFEAAVRANGGEVHWAVDAEAAQRELIAIARRHGAHKVAKSKSMATEECAINEALIASGIDVIETDLGEYILQLADERPSHIVAPVVHKNKEEIADLFADRHHRRRQTEIAALCREAREMLRPQFLAADMGLSGANFLIAESGSALIVTNEGNGRLVTTLPRVHVVLAGIEKVVPTLDDAALLLRLLPRSATGQSITNYVSVLTGPKRAGEADGPEHFHVILVDNGRSRMLGGELEPMLRCIRCGACMNHCPVYQSIGGHPYGWVYPGPMGSVLTPSLVGLEAARDLPNASSLCGACGAVCPVSIPLPDLLRSLRTRQWERRLRTRTERLALALWGIVACRPRLYRFVTGTLARVLRVFGGRRGLIRWLPLGRGWLQGRDLPAPQSRTFLELYRERQSR
jgi:L-lactate dehydrogenase complex protein LldF